MNELDQEIILPDEESHLPWRWTEKRNAVVIELAKGQTITEAAETVGCGRNTIYDWLKRVEFQQELDRLRLIHGMASKSYRMQIITEAAREFVNKDGSWNIKGFTLVDLLREARMQMEGVQIGILDMLAAFDAKVGPSTGAGSDRPSALSEPEEQEAD